MRGYHFILVLLTLFFGAFSFVSAAPVCTNLSSNLSYGTYDASSGSSVIALQDFLFTEGYLAATPNGNFGPATLAAVTAFQIAHGISATGYVGTITRAAIASASCTVSTVSTSVANTPSTPTTTPSANIIAPLGGATLSVGQMYTIAWNSTNKGGYSIVLENQNGLSQGFITPNAQLTGSYNWQVGTVLSGVTNTYTTVPTGTYRIHLYSVSGGASDLYSGIFTITAPPLTISSIVPLSLSESNPPTIVLYGSGFNSSARVSVDGYYNFSATILYASPDGTVLVFSFPAGVSLGIHNIDVSNAYGTLAVSPAITVMQ